MPSRVTWTAAMDVCLRALRQQGYPWAVIAWTLGINPVTVRKRADQLGISTSTYLSSGTLTGCEVVQGIRPQAGRFTRPSTVARLGKAWRSTGHQEAP